jgi:hypothetical protein
MRIRPARRAALGYRTGGARAGARSRITVPERPNPGAHHTFVYPALRDRAGKRQFCGKGREGTSVDASGALPQTVARNRVEESRRERVRSGAQERT